MRHYKPCYGPIIGRVACFMAIVRRRLIAWFEPRYYFLTYSISDVANEESIVQPALATRSSRRLPVRFIMVREEQEPDLRTRAGGIRCYQRPISATKEWTISTAFQHVVNDADITSLPFKFSVHGIVLPGDTPIERLCRHLSHPDHFVYICCCRIPDHSNT